MTTLLPTIGPSDDVAVVLQFAALGALVGTALAARRRARDRDADTWMPPATWALLFASCAGLFVVGKRLRWW